MSLRLQLGISGGPQAERRADRTLKAAGLQTQGWIMEGQIVWIWRQLVVLRFDLNDDVLVKGMIAVSKGFHMGT